jgi:hypothetical protein
MPAELRPLKYTDDVVHSLDPAEQFVTLGEQRQCRGPQARHIFGKRIGRHHRARDSNTIRLA